MGAWITVYGHVYLNVENIKYVAKFPSFCMSPIRVRSLTEHLVQRRWMGLDLGPELGGCGDRSYARIWINAGLIMIMKVAICSPSHGELASSTSIRLYPQSYG